MGPQECPIQEKFLAASIHWKVRVRLAELVLVMSLVLSSEHSLDQWFPTFSEAITP